MHPGQLVVDAATVGRLVAAQFPAWSRLDVREVQSSGTVNALFRIGPRLAARFPLQPGDVEVTRRTLAAEARAMDRLRGRTPFATPEPVALGEPGEGYPLPWAVQTWLPGTTAEESDPGHSTAFARDLATFIRAVRAIDTEGQVFAGENRGGDLRRHDAWVETCLDRSGALLDVPRLRQMWAALRELPRTAPDLMTHGDLTPGNVLVAGGRLTGVLDVGGLGPADPALDLVAAWHLLEVGPRQALREELRSDDLEWVRGQAWAFEQALGLVWYYADSNPAMSRLGARTLARLLAESTP